MTNMRSAIWLAVTVGVTVAWIKYLTTADDPSWWTWPVFSMTVFVLLRAVLRCVENIVTEALANVHQEVTS